MLFIFLLVLAVACLFSPWRNILYYVVALWGLLTCYLAQFSLVPPYANLLVILWCIAAGGMLLDLIKRKRERENNPKEPDRR